LSINFEISGDIHRAITFLRLGGCSLLQ